MYSNTDHEKRAMWWWAIGLVCERVDRSHVVERQAVEEDCLALGQRSYRWQSAMMQPDHDLSSTHQVPPGVSRRSNTLMTLNLSSAFSAAAAAAPEAPAPITATVLILSILTI